MRRPQFLLLCSWMFVPLAVLALTANPWGARAQPPRGEEVKGRLPGPDEESSDKLKERFVSERSAFNLLMKGDTAPSPDNQKVITDAAKWFTYRVTWTELRRPGSMDVLVRELDEQVLQNTAKYKENNQAFMQAFGHEMVTQLRKVLQSDSALTRINGARLLARLGKAGQEEVGDFLVEVLADAKQNEAVKFYALQGLREQFSAARPKSPAEARWIQGLLTFLSSKAKLPESTPAPEADAVRYLRREAIRALGQSRLPAVDKEKGATALVLLHVLVKDGVIEQTSASEQLEAAIGLAQLQSKLFAAYQPDYAASFIGPFLVDFANQANAERGNNPSDAWKYQAARLELALEAMKSDTADNETAGKYIADMAAKALPVLRDIEGGRSADANALRAWQAQKPATLSTSLFKGDSKSTVTAPEPTGG